jgi:hypothetical protein
MDAKLRILKILYENREKEIGVNDFRFPYELNPNTIKRGTVKASRCEFIRIEMRGLKKCHFITEKGIKFYDRHVASESFLKRFLELYDAYTNEEKLKVLGQIFKDMYTSSFDSSPTNLRAMFDSLCMSVMDDINKEWITKKDEILKHDEISGTYQFLGQFSVFTLPPYPLAFIVCDAKLAWEEGYYLSTHHRYVLEKLDYHSKEEIDDKNKEWIEKHGQLNNEFLLEQLYERVKKIKAMIKVVYATPNEPQPYPSGKEPLKGAPNWIREIPERYGESLWDIR